jgi:unsaturated rhamnogalacturonyl hydrolase
MRLSRVAARRTPEKALMFKAHTAAAFGMIVLSGTARAAPAVESAVSVKVANPLPAARSAETIVLKIADLRRLAAGLEAGRTVVVDSGGHLVDSQLTRSQGTELADELVFQTDLRASETKTFVVKNGQRRPSTKSQFKVYGRFVRERNDDFAWENDRIAHRAYGPELETWKAEPLTSSGIDVWTKRVSRLVINDWYMTDNYHVDTGEGADLYSVGKSRGCGGLGIWAGDALHVSRNFVRSRVLSSGPIRLVFELDYEPWDAGGVKIAETKRVTLDAGSNFDRYESVFKLEGKADANAKPVPLSIGIGIAKHEGGVARFEKRGGWLRSWEPLKNKGVNNGNLGCAIVVAPGASVDYKQTDTDHLVLLGGQAGAPVVYHAGFGWDASGDFPDMAAWTRKVEAEARDWASPPRVALSPTQVTSLEGSAIQPWSVRACDSIMKRSPVISERWTYDAGLVLKGFEQVWLATGDRKYFDYIKENVDRLIDAEGTIKGFSADDYNLDNINMGKILFPLLAEAADPRDRERYSRALQTLRAQLQAQPRTSEGGFWHKKIYPNQMWLDGVYMAAPFLAQYAGVFHEPALFDQVADEILLAEKHLRDPDSGLLFHGWDESRAQRWANPKTGTSATFWARGMGWYSMALVDVLEQMPKDHPKRRAVLGVLRRLAAAVTAVQSKTTGVWWQVLDAGGQPKNYPEASASAMFVYSLSKAVRNGWLERRRYAPVALHGYQGVVEQFVHVDDRDQVNLTSICKVAGLGGDPYRDGSFDYYTSTDIVANDPKGLGAFILASVEHH